MGKLNIAHHKSYHPYRRDNIERVRQDEEEAKLKEEREEGRMMLADSEARIQMLRDRAGPSKAQLRKEGEKEEAALLAQATAPRPPPVAGGHINFFEDLEETSITAAIHRSKEADKLVKGKGQAVETDKGFPLAPSAKDLNPWYSAKEVEPETEISEQKRKRDLSRKSFSDPLTSIKKELTTRFPSAPSSSSARRYPPPPQHASVSTAAQPASQLDSRLHRESAERQRALELIRKKKLALAGSETPTTAYGGGGYGNLFNRREVEEAHAQRDRGRDAYARDWDRREEGGKRGRGRGVRDRRW